MTMPTSDAANIPVNRASPVMTYQPVVLDVPGRAVALTLKVSVPATGDDLPIIVLSHGHGASTYLASRHGYEPLSDFWAAHGFVVISPTHLDSGTLDLRGADDPDAPLYTRSRAEDMRAIIDRLDDIEQTVPGLSGRLDRGRIAAAGHSLGGHTVSMLLGMGIRDPAGGGDLDLRDDRIKVAVVFAGPGSGDLAEWASTNYPALRDADFSSMTGEALVVAGDQDLNPMFSERLSFRWDAYSQSPGPKTLLTMHGAEHILGGISGYDAAETSDENPEMVATIRAMVWAYLWSTLYPGDTAWNDAVAALEGASSPLGTVQSK